ncbi:SUMO-specific isopeptidase USPL1-like [Tachypleus tridentatus]|uniref:SUMO-specific isopeptidase USPL1-like n=1 Tax=Tachypleus tridentatus TaxID=6853 RepID=UPI003FD10045
MGQDNTSSGNFTMQEDSQPGKDLLEECKEIQEVELKQSTDAGVLTQQEISKSKRFYPLWMNADNLCWLDAALSLIVHNTKLPYYFSRSSSSQRSVVETVYQSYQSAVDLLNSECGPDVRWNMGKEKFVSESMVSLQEEAFRCLKNKFRCDLGQEDSPVLALMLLLNEEEFLREAFLTNYFWEFKCERCGHHKVDRFQKTILTVPRVLSDFTVTNCYLLQPCLKCGAVDQRKHLQFESLSECIAVHFVDGLLTNSVSSYDFAHHNVQYKVKGVIQYKTNCSPKHFVTWIRNPTENTWLCCDDLQGSKVAFQQEDPQILASQMHVLVWEKEQSDTVVPGYLDQDKTLTQSSSCGSSVHLLQNAVSHPSLVQVPGSALPKETPFVSRSIGPDSTLTSAELQEGIESLAVCSKIQTTLVTSEKHSTLAPSMTDSCSECLKPPHLADLKDENITPVIEYNKLSCNPVFVTTTSVNMTSFVNSQVTSESNCQPAVMITSIVNSTFLTPSVQPTVMTTSSVNSTLLTSGVQPTVMTYIFCKFYTTDIWCSAYSYDKIYEF